MTCDSAERLGWDLCGALKNNGYGDRVPEIAEVLLELEGENDGNAWHWVCRGRGAAEGKFFYVTGSCDYTGWDCRSGADLHEADSLDAALALVPEAHRRVFEEMTAAGERSRPNKVDW